MSDNFSLSTAARAFDGALSRLVHDLVTPPAHPGEEWHAPLAQYRQVRESTIDIVRRLTQKQVDFSPAHETWSIGQILDHLLLSEKLYRTQMERLIELAREGKSTDIELSMYQVNSSFAFIPREVMSLFSIPMKVFNMFVPHAVRESLIRYPLIPALNPTVSDPVRGRPIEVLCESLKSSIAETEALFRGALPANLREMTLSHPVLGTNNIQQILGILGAHEERHQGQIRDRIRQAGGPAA
jgi:uncharacterized damage-inducible protein DinB